MIAKVIRPAPAVIGEHPPPRAASFARSCASGRMAPCAGSAAVSRARSRSSMGMRPIARQKLINSQIALALEVLQGGRDDGQSSAQPPDHRNHDRGHARQYQPPSAAPYGTFRSQAERAAGGINTADGAAKGFWRATERVGFFLGNSLERRTDDFDRLSDWGRIETPQIGPCPASGRGRPDGEGPLQLAGRAAQSELRHDEPRRRSSNLRVRKLPTRPGGASATFTGHDPVALTPKAFNLLVIPHRAPRPVSRKAAVDGRVVAQCGRRGGGLRARLAEGADRQLEGVDDQAPTRRT